MNAQRELARLDAHFVEVVRQLRRQPPPKLSRVQRRARDTHLDRLEAYRRAHRFPRNVRFAKQVLPHFVDDFGTRCAMGHLIEQGGGADLVQHIARDRNYERVHTLANIPELVLWLEANGLTLAEAARIQPTYCGTAANNCVCGPAGYGVIEGILAGNEVTVTTVYGQVMGVSVNDVLPIRDPDNLKPPDGVVFATVFGGMGDIPRTAELLYGATGNIITVPQRACTFPNEITIPSTLPLATVREALGGNCESVITSYDARWGVIQGGCDNGPPIPEPGSGGAKGTSAEGGTDISSEAAPADDGSCAVSSHPTQTHVFALLVSAACIAYGVRRRMR